MTDEFPVPVYFVYDKFGERKSIAFREEGNIEVALLENTEGGYVFKVVGAAEDEFDTPEKKQMLNQCVWEHLKRWGYEEKHGR